MRLLVLGCVPEDGTSVWQFRAAIEVSDAYWRKIMRWSALSRALTDSVEQLEELVFSDLSLSIHEKGLIWDNLPEEAETALKYGTVPTPFKPAEGFVVPEGVRVSNLLCHATPASVYWSFNVHSIRRTFVTEDVLTIAVPTELA